MDRTFILLVELFDFMHRISVDVTFSPALRFCAPVVFSRVSFSRACRFLPRYVFARLSFSRACRFRAPVVFSRVTFSRACHFRAPVVFARLSLSSAHVSLKISSCYSLLAVNLTDVWHVDLAQGPRVLAQTCAHQLFAHRIKAASTLDDIQNESFTFSVSTVDYMLLFLEWESWKSSRRVCPREGIRKMAKTRQINTWNL